VSTLGSDAVDVFFVTDARGSRLSEDRVAALRTTVLASLG
jgi:UTP:GlnB (protein PII) uridylyltransferase